ncbi:unnamed protein product [Camellia sinensis]
MQLSMISSVSFSQTPPLIVSSFSLSLSLQLHNHKLVPSTHSFVSETRMIRKPKLVMFSLLFGLVLISHFNVSSATSTITAVLKDQGACPCQPILPPPPPSPPPPSSDSSCPPPPDNYYYSPPPPLTPSVPTFEYYSPPPPPPSGGGGQFYYPPPSGYNFPAPPPPNPVVPYFPYYYYSPPDAALMSRSDRLVKHSIVSSILLFLILFFSF